MKHDLLPVFHASASADINQDRQDQLRAATFDNFPGAAYCGKTGNGLPFNHAGVYHFINGDRISEAADTIRDIGKNKRVVVVTLCPEMMAAAAARDIPVVTVGIPPKQEGRQFMASSHEHVPNLIRHAVLGR